MKRLLDAIAVLRGRKVAVMLSPRAMELNLVEEYAFDQFKTWTGN